MYVIAAAWNAVSDTLNVRWIVRLGCRPHVAIFKHIELRRKTTGRCLMQCGRSTPLQWRSLSSLLGRHRDVTGSTSHTAEGFAQYFKKKIDDIRSATAGTPQPDVCSRATSSLDTFQSSAEADVRRIIMSSPIKSCSLDPVPTFLLREFVDVLLPYATRMVNASLEEGRLPISQRHAIVIHRC